MNATPDLQLCPRCLLNPKPARGELCMPCRAEEVAEAAGSPAPRGNGAPAPAPSSRPTAAAEQQTLAPARQPEPQRDTKPANPAPSSPAPAQARQPAPIAAARTNGAAAPAARGIGVSSGRKDAPMRIVIYGVQGVGKTRFMVDAPKPIIIPAEAGSEGFDVARFDEPHPPRTFEEVIDAVRWLQTEPHDFQTLGIDTADMVESLAFQLAIRKHNKKSDRKGDADNIEDVGGGYKKGYSAAAEEWRRLLAELERLRNTRKMHIIMAAHSRVVKFANPAGEDYDRFSLKLHPDAGLGLVQEWADAVLFASFKTAVKKQGRRGRAKGIGGKERILYTQHDAAYEAKNRYDLPASLPLDWSTFAYAVESNKSPELLHQAIARALEQLAGEEVEIKGQRYLITDRVAQQLEQRPDNRRLAQIKNWLESRVDELEEERAEKAEAAAAAGDAA